MRILQVVSVMLFALVTGVFWGTWFSLSRSMDAISRKGGCLMVTVGGREIVEAGFL